MKGVICMKDKNIQQRDTESEKAVIVGGGPAGLTAAYELLQQTQVHPVIMEATSEIGGISKTVNYKGNRIDIGGHRFFSKNERVMEWWNRVMPVQGKPAQDDLLLANREKPFEMDGPDPERENRVMLIRERVSRIFYLRHFFDYPISLKITTFTGMGLLRTLHAGMGYLWSVAFKRPETSLENFYINRFGKPLYRMFFEDYTEKVWGVHPSKLGADWGSQRIKGLSVMAILKDMVRKQLVPDRGIRQKQTETSLIEQFIYPKYGPGQLWETVAEDVCTLGGEIRMEHCVERIHVKGNRVTGVTTRHDGVLSLQPCDHLFSSMPIKDLISAIEGIVVPEEVKRIASQLPYRDFITVGLLVNKLKISNHTKIKTYAGRVPDTWIYIQERDVRIGRLQVFNNWSPYMVKDYKDTMWIGLEYFCTEGDGMWTMDKQLFIDQAIGELEHIGLIDRKDVIDSVQIKIRKAYPSYYGSYYELDRVKDFLDGIENLYCIGRNGQHRYNNMDHSMLTAMEAVANVRDGVSSKRNVWEVNTEEEYHESKKMS